MVGCLQVAHNKSVPEDNFREFRGFPWLEENRLVVLIIGVNVFSQGRSLDPSIGRTLTIPRRDYTTRNFAPCGRGYTVITILRMKSPEVRWRYASAAFSN